MAQNQGLGWLLDVTRVYPYHSAPFVPDGVSMVPGGYFPVTDPDEKLRALRAKRHLLIVAEDWCSDSVNTVPYIARLIDGAPDWSPAQGDPKRIPRRIGHGSTMSSSAFRSAWGKSAVWQPPARPWW